jgi:hypothetical protein
MLKKFWNVMILDVDLAKGKLTICRKKREAGKVTYMLTAIFVGVKAKIKDTNGKRFKLSGIKPRDRATLDYAIENGMLIASNIIIDKYAS